MSATTLPQTKGVEYRLIADFPGYCVGDDGSVWSRRKRRWTNRFFDDWHQLKPVAAWNGRLRVSLCRGEGGTRMVKYLVHRLVLVAFVGSCPSGREACHRNDDPADNRLVNLRWDTRESNTVDRFRNGGFDCHRGKRNVNAKLTEDQVREIRQARSQGALCKDLAARFGVSDVLISYISNRKIWAWLP